MLNLIINFFVALGTCGATWLVLHPKEEKEKLEGAYWLYDGWAVVHIQNKGKNNVTFDENVSLLFMHHNNDIATRSIPLKKELILPAGCECNLRFGLTENDYVDFLKKKADFSCCIYTSKGTVVKLERGMGDNVPITVTEQEKYKLKYRTEI